MVPADIQHRAAAFVEYGGGREHVIPVGEKVLQLVVLYTVARNLLYVFMQFLRGFHRGRFRSRLPGSHDVTHIKRTSAYPSRSLSRDQKKTHFLFWEEQRTRPVSASAFWWLPRAVKFHCHPVCEPRTAFISSWVSPPPLNKTSLQDSSSGLENNRTFSSLFLIRVSCAATRASLAWLGRTIDMSACQHARDNKGLPAREGAQADVFRHQLGRPPVMARGMVHPHRPH